MVLHRQAVVALHGQARASHFGPEGRQVLGARGLLHPCVILIRPEPLTGRPDIPPLKRAAPRTSGATRAALAWPTHRKLRGRARPASSRCLRLREWARLALASNADVKKVAASSPQALDVVTRCASRARDVRARKRAFRKAALQTRLRARENSVRFFFALSADFLPCPLPVMPVKQPTASDIHALLTAWSCRELQKIMPEICGPYSAVLQLRLTVDCVGHLFVATLVSMTKVVHVVPATEAQRSLVLNG